MSQLGSQFTSSRVAAAALTGAVALMLVTALADPSLEEGPSLAADTRKAAAGTLVEAGAQTALAVLLAVGVGASLVSLHASRGRRLILAAAMLTVIGAAGFVFDAAVELAVLDLASSDMDPAAVALAAAVLGDGSVETIAFVGILIIWAGLLLFPLGVWKAGRIPQWLAVSLVLVTFLEPPSHQSKAVHVAMHLVLLAGYVLLARMMVRSTGAADRVSAGHRSGETRSTPATGPG
jgi:hypothetical protein